MERIINHWTAGTYKPNATDKAHYHILIDGDGNEVPGVHPISANEKARGDYAAHTLGCNTGSIGVSCCSMAGSTESPLDFGRYPLNEAQWETLIAVNARLCRQYGIAVTPKTVLTHAEVQANLGIRQRNKWDIAYLKFRPDLKGAKAVGDELRAQVAKRLGGKATPVAFMTEQKPALKHRRVQSTVLGFLAGGGSFSIAALQGFDTLGLAIIIGAALVVGGFFYWRYRAEIEAGLFGKPKP